jgi:hypothetical protein
MSDLTSVDLLTARVGDSFTDKVVYNGTSILIPASDAVDCARSADFLSTIETGIALCGSISYKFL